ncbi:MAG: hypothetical protein AB8B53_03940 [Flavobacteriales bacterium]
MKQESLIAMNRIVMYVWLGLGVIGLIACAITYFKEGLKNLSLVFFFTLICFMMFGYKRFMISRFTKNSNEDSK